MRLGEAWIRKSGVYPIGTARSFGFTAEDPTPIKRSELEKRVRAFIEQFKDEGVPELDLIVQTVQSIVAVVCQDLGCPNPLLQGWRVDAYISKKVEGALVFCAYDSAGAKLPFAALEREIDRLREAKGC